MEAAEGGRDVRELSSQLMDNTVDFASNFYNFLAQHVPSVYTSGFESPAEDQEQLYKAGILTPIEWYLFGEDPDTFMEKLCESEAPPLCGKVFRSGEATYSCRECAIDPTCVLCMDCFQNSVHRTHRYKMHTSTGGGFCDCGDTEAWKSGPSCKIHESVASDEDTGFRLTEELLSHTRKLFPVLTQYIVDMLVKEDPENLPVYLKSSLVKPNLYYCLVYNDELDSSENFLYSLQRALGRTRREVHTLAHDVEQEGRTIIKEGTLDECQKLAAEFKRNFENVSMRAVRLEVLSFVVLAHQTSAHSLGVWLNKLLGYSSDFRQIFSQVCLEPQITTLTQQNHVTLFILNDAKLHRGLKKLIHDLIFSSFFKEMEYKKLFSIEFVKCYKKVQKEYMDDERDKHISITAFSVQVFTVPTVARLLIEEQNVIQVLSETLLEVLPEYLNADLKFNFQGYKQDRFCRVYAILFDFKYTLTSKPTSWTDKLKEKFLEGFHSFLCVLSCMQSMEPITRMIGQHVEREADWEAAVAMHMQLKHVLRLIQEWCASNEDVLRATYKHCHHRVLECIKPVTAEEKTLVQMCGHSYYSYPFKVSRDPVSIHLPLSRLLAGLHSQMSKTGLLTSLPELIPPDDFHVEMLIESSLQCLVFTGQVFAEMWKRNGLSIVSQVFYYKDVKCREEMFDKDIVMLQLGASIMDPNDFLLLLLDRYELVEALSKVSMPTEDMDQMKQWNMLIQEMLYILICIIGERYVPGVSNVTREESLMREIIHLLCIDPMPRSAIGKALPEMENTDICLDTLINKVATFKKPGVSGHGVYELKDEYLNHFNVYFYHYTKTQRSKAEHTQKKRRKQDNSSEELPPPPPPEFTPAFQNVSKLLCCDVMMHVLRTILQRAAEEDATRWTEGMIQMALHIITLGLMEEKHQLQKSTEEEVAFDFYHKASRIGSSDESASSLVIMLEKLKNVLQLEVQKDLICWVCQLLESVKRLREKSGHIAIATSSSDVNKADEGPSSQDKEKRKRKAEAARLHREKIMAQMSAMQKNFIETNKLLYDASQEVEGSPTHTEEIPFPVTGGLKITLGPKRGPSVPEKEVLTCILCQEEQEVRLDKPTMVLTASVQKSTTLSQSRGMVLIHSDEVFNPFFVSSALSCETYTGSCGHVMHVTCWRKFEQAVRARAHESINSENINDLLLGEYLCPLCKCLCNGVMPIIPITAEQVNSADAEILAEMVSLPRWLDVVGARLAGFNLQFSKGESKFCPEFIMGEESNIIDFRSIYNFGAQTPPNYSDSAEDMLFNFTNVVYGAGLAVQHDGSDPYIPVMSWNTCAFSIQSIESLLRYEDKPLFGSLQNRQLSGLKALVKFAEAQRVTRCQTSIQNCLVQLLAVFLPNVRTEVTPCFLTLDTFHLLVGSVLGFPSLYCEDGLDLDPSPAISSYNNLLLFRLLTMTHMLQIIFSSATDNLPAPVSVDCQEAHDAAALCRDLSLLIDGAGDFPGWYIWDCIKKGIVPYLRCSALFFHYLLGVTPPDELHSSVAPEEEFGALCSYLYLPTNLFTLFHEYWDTMKPLIQRWGSDPAVLGVLSGENSIVRYPRTLNSLTELPDEYSVLLNQASHFRCPKSQDTEHKHPVLCLLCGVMLCSQNLCCQVDINGEELGACTAHALHCGAGICIFLKIRECKVILMEWKTRGCYYPAPYLDQYGETDPGLKRGNPLRLSHERYRKLHLMWQQHGILEQIAHTLEINTTFVGFHWNLL
ncbi:E3 ubiquitin-protein ligase UBR1 isoform 1-T1 [Anomaloglossus baeobatrachus]|uniref:E3 ubiquitin-protein ligase UBR1 n=1 Tax=Anomaloglossus baeobatrachus TaxID=238106 RepID=UPI003F5020A8